MSQSFNGKPTVCNGGVICAHCGETKPYLDALRVNGKLPVYLDAPQTQGNYIILYSIICCCSNHTLYLY